MRPTVQSARNGTAPRTGLTPLAAGTDRAHRHPKRPRPASLMPGLPGAPTVELARVSGMEPELIRHRALLDATAALDFPHPAARFAGRGIVICGGGAKYFPCVYVLVRLLRHLGSCIAY